ncbi:MAG TPA: hypothetical protein PLJ10_03390, partial [Candidatus Hydrogenedens sp.]|nr:hypothetical protein [Candidatus Hydrogenedens sp.]
MGASLLPKKNNHQHPIYQFVSKSVPAILCNNFPQAKISVLLYNSWTVAVFTIRAGMITTHVKE